MIFTLIQLTNQMRDIYMNFWLNSKWLSKQLLVNFNFFFTTPKSQKSNVGCLKVLSSSQNLQCPVHILYVRCPISILQNSWQSEILPKIPLYELDSKAGPSCSDIVNLRVLVLAYLVHLYFEWIWNWNMFCQGRKEHDLNFKITLKLRKILLIYYLDNLLQKLPLELIHA